VGGVSGTRSVGGIRSNGNSSMSCFIWLPIHEERLCLLDTIEYVYIADYVHIYIYIYIFARKRMTWGNGWRTRYTLVSSASPVSAKLHIRNMMWFNHHACRYKYVSLYANKNKSRVTKRRIIQDVRTQHPVHSFLYKTYLWWIGMNAHSDITVKAHKCDGTMSNTKRIWI
jgi:hypothetical protein